MPLMNQTQVHIDVPLTNYTVAQLQSTEGFIAGKIMPPVPVSKQSDKFYIWDRGDFNRNDGHKKMAAGTAPERHSLSLSTGSYFADVYGDAFILDEQMAANEDEQLDVAQAGMYNLSMKTLLGMEKNWLDTFFKAGVWTTEITGVASASPTYPNVTQWSDYTDSTPITDVRAAKLSAQLASGNATRGVRAKMVVTRDVHNKLMDHPDIIARISGGATVSNPALVSNAMIAAVFEIDEYHIMDVVENTAKEGQAEVNAFLSEKKAAIYFTPETSGRMTATAGNIFTWSSLPTDNPYSLSVQRYQNDELARQHIVAEYQMMVNYDMKVTGADMAIFFDDIIA